MTLPRLLLVLLLAALAWPVAAHETTRSYLSLDRQAHEVAARLRLAFRDIEVVAWMDNDLDGRITWGEARARLDAATSYAAARVSIDAGGACPLQPAGAGVSQSAGIDYLDLAFVAICPSADAPLRVGSSLYAEIDPGHRLFLTSSDNGREARAVLGPGDAPAELASSGAGRAQAFGEYFVVGVEHLLAGWDHLLFLLVLLLPAAVAEGDPRRRFLSIVASVTGFTIAHGLTLTAAATQLLRPPSALIEALIALSILLTAIHNIRPFIPGPRSALAAFFGTIHGFGFASALSLAALGGGDFVVALLGFNLGIELAQVALVLLALPVLALLSGGRWTVPLGSVVAGSAAVFWLWQRLPLVSWTG